MQAVRSEFDYVFIDTPPLLAVSDPCVISPHVDGMLLVVRMHKNKRPAVVRARDMLNSHGVVLYGVIANDMTVADSSDDEYGAYAAYYSTGPVTESTPGTPSPGTPTPSTPTPSTPSPGTPSPSQQPSQPPVLTAGNDPA